MASEKWLAGLSQSRSRKPSWCFILCEAKQQQNTNPRNVSDRTSNLFCVLLQEVLLATNHINPQLWTPHIWGTKPVYDKSPSVLPENIRPAADLDEILKLFLRFLPIPSFFLLQGSSIKFVSSKFCPLMSNLSIILSAEIGAVAIVIICHLLALNLCL